jgi:hypothetical protein
MSAPTFVAKFANGEITRMTCDCTAGRLDPAQGVRMSRAAYESRIRSARRAAHASKHGPHPSHAPWPTDSKPVMVPEIVAASFETADGEKLATYSAEQLAATDAASETDTAIERGAP